MSRLQSLCMGFKILPLATLCYAMSGIFPIFDSRGIRHAVASRLCYRNLAVSRRFKNHQSTPAGPPKSDDLLGPEAVSTGGCTQTIYFMSKLALIRSRGLLCIPSAPLHLMVGMCGRRVVRIRTEENFKRLLTLDFAL